jgi:hypothetical protein
VCRNSENPAAFKEAGGTRSVPTTFRNGKATLFQPFHPSTFFPISSTTCMTSCVSVSTAR